MYVWNCLPRLNSVVSLPTVAVFKKDCLVLIPINNVRATKVLLLCVFKRISDRLVLLYVNK